MTELSVNQAMAVAVEHHRAGRLAEAEAIYRQVLSQFPNHAEALHLLGLIAHQTNHSQLAIDLILKAIAIAPNQVEFYNNLSAVFVNAGRIDEAIAAAQKAIELQPTSAEAHNNLAISYMNVREWDGAIAALEKAITINPGLAIAHSNLGISLSRRDRFEEAIASFERAMALQPRFSHAHVGMADALRRERKFPEALDHCRKAIDFDPASYEAYNTLANVLPDLGDLDQAITNFRRSIELRPNHANTLSNLAMALLAAGRVSEANEYCQKSIDAAPRSPESHYNFGVCLMQQGQLALAIKAFETTIQLDPKFAFAHNNRGNVLKDVGRVEEAITCYRSTLSIDPQNVVAHSNLCYAMHYTGTYAPEQIFQEHQLWARSHAEPLMKRHRPHMNDASMDRPLRVGYVSPNFKDQVINYCFEPTLRAHDRKNVEVYCYSDVSAPDLVTARLKEIGHAWRDCASMSDEQLAGQIRADGIDILVDLTGHIGGNRLLVFARKPAPVQVTYLGYQNTTGLGTMDYLLSDDYTNPPGQNENLYTEKLVRLPGCFWCYLPQESPDINALPATNAGHVTFAMLNNFAKLTPMMMARWCEILKRVPASKLLVLTREVVSSKPLIEKMFRDNQVELDRLVVEGPRIRPEYMKLFSSIDIALDPFPFNGHTTTHDCLWMGVPVVHLSGNTYHSRYGGSVLRAAGLDEWITTTADDYVNLAVRLASDIEALAAIRPTLRGKILDSKLVDATGFTANLELAYREMWQTWCRHRD